MRRNENVESQTRPQTEGEQHYLAGVVEFAAAIRHWTRRTEVGPNWKPDSYRLNPGQTITVLGNNPQRKHALFWVDSDAAGPVWISNVTINDDPLGRDRSGAIRLMPGAAPLPMDHCGALFARGADANGAATVLRTYVEFLRA